MDEYSKSRKEWNYQYLSEEDKNIIVEFLKDKLDPEFIYLFGSFARGEGREDSDIDLAIYTNKKTDAYDLFITGNQLSFEVKRDIEIM